MIASQYAFAMVVAHSTGVSHLNGRLLKAFRPIDRSSKAFRIHAFYVFSWYKMATDRLFWGIRLSNTKKIFN